MTTLANGPRKIVGAKYHHRLQPEENTLLYEQKLKKAGCFVMITKTAKEKLAAREVLKTYKQQYGVEKNFSFLKEPLIANDTFLKKPSRIDALRLILLGAECLLEGSSARKGNKAFCCR